MDAKLSKIPMFATEVQLTCPLFSGEECPGRVPTTCKHFLNLQSNKVHELVFHYRKFALRRRDTAATQFPQHRKLISRQLLHNRGTDRLAFVQHGRKSISRACANKGTPKRSCSCLPRLLTVGDSTNGKCKRTANYWRHYERPFV
jgi:hypothetical protein